MSVVIGAPKKPEPDERPGFYVHKNLTCYLDTQPDGVYVDGKTPKGETVFRIRTGNSAEALQYVANKQALFKDSKDSKRDE